MKSTAVDESLSSINQQFCSRENQLLQMLQQNEKSAQMNKQTMYTASLKTFMLQLFTSYFRINEDQPSCVKPLISGENLRNKII